MFSRANRHGSSCLGFLSTLLVIAVLVKSFTTSAYAAVGRTPGTFAVSPSAAATYTIPIWSPPGTHGVQPHIALTYNSQQGNGYVGVGWSVSGLSSIYRCNLTVAQDAAAAAVALAVSDGYCMDGQRLRLTGGTYGSASSTYQTEIANFVNVEAYGTSGGGPAYWVATATNGWKYTYGGGGTTSNAAVPASSSNSTVVSWQLSEVADTNGNSMTVTYSTNNATARVVPNVISWVQASTGSSNYNYTMTFNYSANGSVHGYLGGTAVNNTNLLSSIAIAYQGAAVKTYYLTYSNTATATSRNVLTQVQECAGTGTSNCLQPTTATYQPGVAGVGGGTTLSSASGSGVVTTAYDLNGDGYNDLVIGSSSGAYSVAFGGPNGYGTPVSTGITRGSALIGDVDGSGVASLVANVNGTWYCYKWNGSSFVGTSTGVAVAATAGEALADVDGDGRADLIQAESDGFIHVRLNTSSGGSVSFSSTDINTGISLSIGLSERSASNPELHFWGDNQGDIVETTETCIQYVKPGSPNCVKYEYIYYQLHFTGSTFIDTGGYNNVDAGNTLDIADYNDDGCSDVLTSKELILSACNGNAPVTVLLPAGVTPIGGMDWDGDGRRDVLVSQSNGYVGVVLSTGTGVSSTVINTSIPYTSGSGYIAAPNLSGDGQDGLVVSNATSIVTYLHNSPGAPPDLLASISDGYGNSVSPSYVSLPRSIGATYYEWNDAQYPYQNYNGPIYLTSSAIFSDPSSASGGTYYQNYFYAGLWLNLQGRGLSPFGNVQTHDSRNGVWDTLAYQRAFPYTGLFSSETKTSNNNSSGLLFQFSSSIADTVISNTPYQQIYFPYLSNETTQNYELGSSSTRLVRTASTNYSYDGYGNAKTLSRTVTDNDSSDPPYFNQSWTTAITNMPDPNPSTGCLNLLTQTQVTYTDSNNDTPVTRTKQFTPDLTYCRYNEIVTEPSSSTYKVTEDLGYDSFGNINSDTITGVGMPARPTTITWSNSTYTTGQFPLSITDASGATMQFAYNYSLGVPSSKTDPNGETTSWQYGDGFGRKTLETRPDGTSTIWSYSLCSGCDPLPRMVISEQPRDTSGNVITTAVHYGDMLDRPLYELATLLNGAPAWAAIQKYDSLGRVQSKYFPFLEAGSSVGQVTYGYDVLNRVTQIQRPISSTNSTLQTTGYQYAGDTTTITDPQSNSTTLIKDPNGWLRESKDAYGYTVILGYDAAGGNTSVTDSLSNTLWSGSYAYGIQPFLLGFTDMDRGSWGFTVDALGEKVAWTDADGHSFSEAYDSLSRPTSRTEQDLFTQWTWGSAPSAHNVGMLQSVCTGTGTSPKSCTTSPGLSETRTYDADARPYQRTITLPGGTSYTYTWQYNATTGLLNTLTYPVTTSGYAFEIQYGYSNGILLSLTDISDAPNVTLWQANAQNPAGQITQETLGNGIVVNRAFDAVTHWLASIQAGLSGGTGAENQSFLYDEMGNVTQRQDNNLGLTENAYYDNDYRLTSTKLNGTQNLSITYDNTMGNITARSDVAAGAAWTYSTTQKHAVTQAGSSSYAYAYDANGNMSSHQGQTIQWSSYNYPTSISAGSGSTAESVAFAYGPNRNRWQQVYTGNGTTETTDYVGGLMDVVISGAAVDYRHYVYAGSEPVAVYSRKSSGVNTFSYMLADHQSSVAKITNSSGAVVVSESFTPSGNRRNPTTWSGSASNSDLTTAAGISRQGYTFQTQLGLWMGLNHMNGRVEDAIIGRFLSADPYIPDPTNTQSYNRYAYTNSNPLTQVDPTGFDNETCAHDAQCGGGDPLPQSYPTDPQLSGAAAASQEEPPTSEVTVTASRQGDQPSSEDASIEAQLWPTTFFLGNQMLADAFQPQVCQSIGMYGTCMITSPRKAAAIANVQGKLAAFGGTVLASMLAPAVGIELLTGGAAEAPAATLELAQQIAAESAAPWTRTVALMETAEGPTLVAGGATDLSAAQAALAQRLGLTVANVMPGFDAEVTLINSAGQMGLTPLRGVATNLICPSCQALIEELGGTVSGRSFSFVGPP